MRNDDACIGSSKIPALCSRGFLDGWNDAAGTPAMSAVRAGRLAKEERADLHNPFLR